MCWSQCRRWIKPIISNGLRGGVMGGWRGRGDLGLAGIPEDGADELVVEGQVLAAEGQKAELVELGLAQLLGQQPIEKAKVVVGPLRADPLCYLGFEVSEVDPSLLRWQWRRRRRHLSVNSGHIKTDKISRIEHLPSRCRPSYLLFPPGFSKD